MDSFLQTIQPYLAKWRRQLHKKPELGFTEYLTTYLIGKELLKMGFSLFIGKEVHKSESRLGVPDQRIFEELEQKALEEGVEEGWLEKMTGGHTGLVAKLDTGNPGPHFAFRFDIDALPINESSTIDHIPAMEGFRSSNEETMHACGHDGHAAIGLGLAKYLSSVQHDLHGTFTFLFQPAEEGGRGAKSIVEKGWLDDVDYFLSGHIGLRDLEVGTIAATTDQFLASSKLNVTFEGKSAHAALEPEKGRNALLAAAAATVHLYNVPRHSEGETRINVGKLHAGSGRNIIADKAYMEVETRGATTSVNQYVLSETKRIIASSADLYNVHSEIEMVGETKEVTCDPEWIDWLNEMAKESLFVKKVIPRFSMKASEDVTFMIDRVQQNGGKATYMIFGSPVSNGHHHPQFDFDENALKVAVESLGRVVMKLAKKECEVL